ncbi:stage V sporulation protein AB [Bacillus massilinigeriensis]|uniref:stage V sporulation protein AB n=1 Tax=Bacillus massilionigeriensis TaxID=1805475 RepID=UPI00096AF1E5|nr:stage V sporulation protein AB [Bacillus massilionigeriensis]
MIISALFIMFLGFAGGLSVGSGFVAFLTVLGIIPRLTQLTKTMGMIHWYEWAVVCGAITGTIGSLMEPMVLLPIMLLIPIGLLSGVYNGMLAAALTEVLNVFPILAKRVRIDDKIIILVMAFVFGKIFGSLFQWIYFVNE